MNQQQRTAYYAKNTGLSKADVTRYRTARVNDWTTTADRRIGSTIRASERLAEDPDLSWSDWLSETKKLLHVIHDFIKGVLTTVAEFVERLAEAARRVLEVLGPILASAAVIAAAFAPLLRGP